jgi:hypothetical protein
MLQPTCELRHNILVVERIKGSLGEEDTLGYAFRQNVSACLWLAGLGTVALPRRWRRVLRTPVLGARSSLRVFFSSNRQTQGEARLRRTDRRHP